MSDYAAVELLRQHAFPLRAGDDFAPLLAHIGEASIVLLGEATHGTREFYAMRADISARLITEKGFDAIAVEADWPDALRVNRYLHHSGEDCTVNDALKGFQRFPQWMWRNMETVKLVDWLRLHNMRTEQAARRVGFFGLDVYSMRQSMHLVVHYLEQVDPQAARKARARYACFDHMADDPQRYGYATSFGMVKDCEEEVLQQLLAMLDQQVPETEGPEAEEALFQAQQNARVTKNAEAYYRAMFSSRDASWNLRDTHMADTLEVLLHHISKRKGAPAKIIVWAHNSHIGDARATEMGEHGQFNLGQLVRERYAPHESFLLGFTTHTGSVTAASEWDGGAELKEVVPSRADSYERLFHDTRLGNFWLPLGRQDSRLHTELHQRRLERAIGVIYLPRSERVSHYFHADLPRQFDAVIHLDRTTAIRPLDPAPQAAQDMPETYPFGM
ncbi:MAG TPA: erythromycin esterase family protein [Noviherbaspirillum sp.]|nr:erythromycin esterase family protein [Noviherbaspirillum sp.]